MEAMIKNKSKTQGMMITFFLMMIFPFVLVCIWSSQYIRNDTDLSFEGNLKRFTHNTSLESVSRSLDDIELVFKIFASHITPKDLEEYIHPEESVLNATVASMVNALKFFDNALFSDAKGNFRSYPEMDTSQLILEQREWYKSSMYKKYIEYSKPYQSNINTDNELKMIVTVSLNLFDNAMKKFGNVAFDLDLEAMSTMLKDLMVPFDGKFLVASRGGEVVISQVRNDLINKKVPLSWVNGATEQEGHFYDSQTRKYIFYRNFNNPDWVALTIVDKESYDAFSSKSQDMLGWVILTSVVIYGVGIFLCRIYIREIINRLYMSVNGITYDGKENSLERVYYSIKSSRDELKNSHNELNKVKRMSCEDPLTGVGTRRKLEEEIAVLLGNQTPFYFTIIDLDNFKHINDTFGHGVGDMVLKYVSKIGKAIMEPDYKIYRFGGEELVVIFPGDDYENYYELMETWRETVHQRHWREEGLHISFSGGMAAWQEGDSMSDILKRADDLLYAAKNSGKNAIFAQAS